MVVKVVHCLGYLLYDGCSLDFRQDLVLFELRVESALLHVLQYDEQMGLVVKKTIDPQYVLVVEETLQPHF